MLAPAREPCYVPFLMATILLVGSGAALLEGLSQTLAAVGHSTTLAMSMAEALEVARSQPPLIALVERLPALEHADSLRMPLVPGGAVLLFRTTADAADAAEPLPASLQRIVLADLTLPLERKRLVTLVRHVDERVRATGRGRMPTPPEHRVI